MSATFLAYFELGPRLARAAWCGRLTPGRTLDVLVILPARSSGGKLAWLTVRGQHSGPPVALDLFESAPAGLGNHPACASPRHNRDDAVLPISGRVTSLLKTIHEG